MDESKLSAAERTTELYRQQAIASLNGSKTYTVIAIGKNGGKPFYINAKSAQERSDQMTAVGINLGGDKWAAGYVDGHRALQVCGNNDEAKRLVEQHLRKR